MKKQYLPPVLDILSYCVEEGYAMSVSSKKYLSHTLDFKPNGLKTSTYIDEDTEPWTDDDAWITF